MLAPGESSWSVHSEAEADSCTDAMVQYVVLRGLPVRAALRDNKNAGAGRKTPILYDGRAGTRTAEPCAV
jgi:hypothetical protein